MLAWWWMVAMAQDPGCVADACPPGEVAAAEGRSVTGGALAVCSADPLTGWFRDGACRSDARDRGLHVVCAEMTDAFLSLTAQRGNDLGRRTATFPGLKAGDRWCLCAARWEEARRAGVAPRVVLGATERAALRVVTLADLEAHAVDEPAAHAGAALEPAR